MNKEYLGDGVYVEEVAYKGCVQLTTENGLATTNTIVLEPEVLLALDNWRKRQAGA